MWGLLIRRLFPVMNNTSNLTEPNVLQSRKEKAQTAPSDSGVLASDELGGDDADGGEHGHAAVVELAVASARALWGGGLVRYLCMTFRIYMFDLILKTYIEMLKNQLNARMAKWLLKQRTSGGQGSRRAGAACSRTSSGPAGSQMRLRTLISTLKQR